MRSKHKSSKVLTWPTSLPECRYRPIYCHGRRCQPPSWLSITTIGIPTCYAPGSIFLRTKPPRNISLNERKWAAFFRHHCHTGLWACFFFGSPAYLIFDLGKKQQKKHRQQPLFSTHLGKMTRDATRQCNHCKKVFDISLTPCSNCHSVYYCVSPSPTSSARMNVGYPANNQPTLNPTSFLQINCQ